MSSRALTPSGVRDYGGWRPRTGSTHQASDESVWGVWVSATTILGRILTHLAKSKEHSQGHVLPHREAAVQQPFPQL